MTGLKKNFPEKKPDMSEDAGGLTVCNIDWKKEKHLCKFCKMYYRCTIEQKQLCLSRPADTLCNNFAAIHPKKGGYPHSPEFLAAQILRKTQHELTGKKEAYYV